MAAQALAHPPFAGHQVVVALRSSSQCDVRRMSHAICSKLGIEVLVKVHTFYKEPGLLRFNEKLGANGFNSFLRSVQAEVEPVHNIVIRLVGLVVFFKKR